MTPRFGLSLPNRGILFGATSVDELLEISELARRALTSPGTTRAAPEPKAIHGLRPFAKRGGIVTNELIDRLREDDAY